MLIGSAVNAISLPSTGPNPRYYATHVQYFRSILDSLGLTYALHGAVGDGDVRSPSNTKFLVLINDKRVVIDFSDHTDYLANWDSFDAYFKFHYVWCIHGGFKKIYPFSPISFYDWAKYQALASTIRYTCNSNFVLNMQRPGGNAIERRKLVQEMLTDEYGKDAQTNFITQEYYWERINDCLVHVFVPGARNDMLDRGHIQYLAFGCCTIAPPIVDELPFGGVLVPNVHYVACAPDYSDLIEKVEWCRNNRNACVGIGSNAKDLFVRTSTPHKLWQWILEKL